MSPAHAEAFHGEPALAAARLVGIPAPERRGANHSTAIGGPIPSGCAATHTGPLRW